MNWIQPVFSGHLLYESQAGASYWIRQQRKDFLPDTFGALPMYLHEKKFLEKSDPHPTRPSMHFQDPLQNNGCRVG